MENAQWICEGTVNLRSWRLPADALPLLPSPPQAIAIREEGERTHGTFMSMTQQLLTGDLEIGLYEDQVRALLGTNSYELFTLDKLINKLLSHMRIMVQVGSRRSPLMHALITLQNGIEAR